jgi:hypothetical protein
MNLVLILIPQSLNSQFLNLAPYSHYDEDGVQKSDLVFRSNNKVCNKWFRKMKYLFVIASLFLLNSGFQAFAQQIDHIHDIETRVVAICSDKPDTKNILGTGFIATKRGLVVALYL